MRKLCTVALILLTLSLLSGCMISTTPQPTPTRKVNTSRTAAPPKNTKEHARPISTSNNTRGPRATTATPSASATATETATFTVTFTPTLTATPTKTVTPSVTQTPTATFTPFFAGMPTQFPMSIITMRRGIYPGSEIFLDEKLDPGSNYQRYYVHYYSEGLKIYALLTVPDGDMPKNGWPGIVFNHGYIPPQEYRTTERYVAYVDRLAKEGYIVFRIDYRGHGSSDGDPQGAYGNPGYTTDVLNAVSSLRHYPLVNPDKLGMWGHSMGGYLTLRSMVISKDIKAGVIWAGVVAPYIDILYNWPSGPSIPPANSRKWMSEWPARFGTPEENPEFWNSISANSYLADISGPIQIHYGTNDEVVPPTFSETLTNELKAVGKPVDTYIYPDDNHNLSNYFNLAMDRTIDFFNSILK